MGEVEKRRECEKKKEERGKTREGERKKEVAPEYVELIFFGLRISQQSNAITRIISAMHPR